MGVTKAMRDAVRTARRDRGGPLGTGGAVVVAVGVLLAWLASRRSATPPVRATGVTANLPRTRD